MSSSLLHMTQCCDEIVSKPGMKLYCVWFLFLNFSHLYALCVVLHAISRSVFVKKALVLSSCSKISGQVTVVC